MKPDNSWEEYGNSLPETKRKIFFMDLAKKTMMVEELQRRGVFAYGDYYYFFRIFHNLEDYLNIIPEDILDKYLGDK